MCKYSTFILRVQINNSVFAIYLHTFFIVTDIRSVDPAHINNSGHTTHTPPTYHNTTHTTPDTPQADTPHTTTPDPFQGAPGPPTRIFPGPPAPRARRRLRSVAAGFPRERHFSRAVHCLKISVLALFSYRVNKTAANI